jgi:hypothetical protein
VDAEQLTLDDIVDDGPEDWEEWFRWLPRIPGEHPPDESEERDVA